MARKGVSRCARQLARLCIQDTETVTGTDGEILDHPSTSEATVPPLPLELLERRPRLWMMNRATVVDPDHRKMDDEEEPDALPNTRTPKRNSEETNFPYGPNDQIAHLGGSKRMHMESNVTVVDQCFDPSTRRCMREKEPADMEMDQSVHQDTDRTKPEGALAVKLTH